MSIKYLALLWGCEWALTYHLYSTGGLVPGSFLCLCLGSRFPHSSAGSLSWSPSQLFWSLHLSPHVPCLLPLVLRLTWGEPTVGKILNKILNLSIRRYFVCAQHEMERALDPSAQTLPSPPNSIFSLWWPSLSHCQNCLLFSLTNIAPYWLQDILGCVSVGTGELLKSLSLQPSTLQTPPIVFHNCLEMHGVSHVVA